MAIALRETATRATPAPAGRDGFVEVLGVLAVVVLLAHHWLMPVLSGTDGRVDTGGAVSTTIAWTFTVALPVTPLVFFAGGAAATTSLREHRRSDGTGRTTTADWLGAQLRRLTGPVVPFAVVWLPLPHVLPRLGVPAEPMDVAADLTSRLLWFLCAYCLVLTLTATLVRAHERWRGKEIVVLAGCAAAVDVARFAWPDAAGPAGYANLIFVSATVYQAGVAFASGRLDRLRPSEAWRVCGTGLAVATISVLAGPYTSCMIATPGVPLAGMDPPAAVLLAVAAAQLGLVLALRPLVQGWISSAPVARGLAWFSQRLITIYLWHLPALVVTAGALTAVGYRTAQPFTAQWREQQPWWLLSLGAVLAGLVHVFARCERQSAWGTALPRIRRVTGSSTLTEHGRLEA